MTDEKKRDALTLISERLRHAKELIDEVGRIAEENEIDGVHFMNRTFFRKGMDEEDKPHDYRKLSDDDEPWGGWLSSSERC